MDNVIEIIVIVIVIFFSNKGPTNPKDVDPKLMSPVFDIFVCWLPSSIREKLRCGVDYSQVLRLQVFFVTIYN